MCMSMRKSILAVIGLLMMFSCQSIDVLTESMSAGDELFASMEMINGTKTCMDENNNVLWSADDQLVAFRFCNKKVDYRL